MLKIVLESCSIEKILNRLYNINKKPLPTLNLEEVWSSHITYDLLICYFEVDCRLVLRH